MQIFIWFFAMLATASPVVSSAEAETPLKTNARTPSKLTQKSIPSSLRSIHIRLSSAPQTLDWNIATSGSEIALIRNLMDGLFSQDVTGFPVKSLAKDFHWSKDQKTLSVEIRSGVKWTDQKPLVAKDFIYSFKRLLAPQIDSENASLLFDVKGAQDYFLGKTKDFDTVGIKAKSAHALQFQLKEPRYNFLSILTHQATFPMREDAPAQTLGAYRLKTMTPEEVTLQAIHPKNEIQTAFFEVVTSSTEAIDKFKSGKLDYLLQLEDSLMTSGALVGLPGPGFVDPIRVVALLHINPARVVSNSPEKRRAIMDQISTRDLVAESPKTRVEASNIIPGGSGVTGAFHPEGAKASLPETSLTLAYPNDAFSRSLAENIQKNTAKLKIKIEPLPAGDFSTATIKTAAKKYDLILTLFGLDYRDPDQLLGTFLSQGTHDFFNVSNSQLVKLVSKGRATENIEERNKIELEAADLLQNQIAIVMPLFYRRRSFLINSQFGFDERRQGTANLKYIHPDSRKN